nr:MAG: replication associated protein [Cressdnaviricota sp.]
MAQSRNHCFTLNNPVGGELDAIMQWDCAYIIVGEEVGESGTPHLQGYVEWNSAKRLTTLKKLNERVHWEVRRGTAQQAMKYCKKDGAFHERGECSQQGKRSDLEEVGKLVLAKTPMAVIAAAHPATFIKFHKGINALASTLMTHRTTRPTVTWTWGAAGVGKTRSAVEAHLSSHYIKDGTQWWDGYTQQEAIIIDDFDVMRWPYRDLLRLLDRYEYQGQYKGGYVPVNSPFIYVTAEKQPSDLWRDNELAQVVRRIDRIIHVEVFRETTPSLAAHDAVAS